MSKLPRSIHLTGVTNARELGGIPAAGGRKVRNGLLLRTGALCDGTADDLRRLEQVYHLAWVADFRTLKEAMARPDPPSHGTSFYHLLVIDESQRELTLCDQRLEQAVQQTKAQLIVLDPIQAYLGDGVDMHRANEVRPVLKRVAAMAERTGCAVILIGHMNKAQGLKAGYRGLGSIDFRAAARSVLVVGRLKDDPTVRVVAQDKNSLAPEGKSIAFLLDGEHGFQWKGACDLSVDDVLSGGGRFQTKTTQMEEELERMLTEAMPAEAVLSRARELGVSERTLMIAKKNLGVISEKRGGQWYWHLPEQGCKDVTT